ncbi:MAG: FtsX-like permease family protein [Propionibacteriales bacterium]|nr:FtsX-like permease family protein [Propionibacteriales bacterium]
MRYLLDRAAPVGWAEVRRLNRLGLGVFSRAVFEDPPPLSERYARASTSQAGVDAETLMVFAMVVSAIVLEVVLLAAPAFAVGVRRQRRQLALLGATGGEPRHLRAVVLAQGLVLGVLSAVLGSAAGLGLAWVAAGVAEGQRWYDFGPFDVRWYVLALAAGFGSLSALLAAYFPARRAARTDVLATLAGRRGTTTTRWGWPVAGLILMGVGTAIVFTAVTSVGGSSPLESGEFKVAFGTVALVLGAVAVTPAGVGLVGRLSRRMPLPLRFAVRDAARQRARTAPAVAAVMASVIGLTALAIGSSSDFAEGRENYHLRHALGTTAISVPGKDDEAAVAGLEGVAREAFPGQDVWRVGQTRGWGLPVVRPGCSPEDQRRCAPRPYGPNATVDAYGERSLVVDLGGLDAFGIRLDERALGTLRSGGAVVANPAAIDDRGMVRLRVKSTGKVTPVPAVASDALAGRITEAGISAGTPLVITPETADKAGLPWRVTEIVVPGGSSSGPSGAEADDLEAAAKAVSARADVSVERGFQESYTLVFVLLAAVGALIVLVGTLTATGLALADARPDLATLSAVGASPRTRRLVATGQALTIGLLGAGLGVAIGFVPGIAVTWPLTQYSRVPGPIIDIPWLLLGVIAVGVPLLSAGTAGLFARSRLPVVRRTEV